MSHTGTKAKCRSIHSNDLSAVKQKSKAKKAVTAQTVEIALLNVEKAHLVAEI